MLSADTIAARLASPGAHVAARRRIFGDPRTLYGAVHGVFGLARISDRIMDVWMENPKLNENVMVQRWHESRQKHGFKFLVTQIFGYMTGGPQRYTGRTMAAAHKHLAITAEQWDSFFKDADQVFDEFKMDPACKEDLLRVLMSFRDQCIIHPGEEVPPDPGASKPRVETMGTLF